MYSNHYQYPVHETSFNTPSAQPIYSNQYGPVQYANNTYANQASQPVYQSAYSQPPVYAISPQQQEFPSYPQYSGYTYTNQQSQPTYQTIPQQSPPAYQTVVHSSSYPAPRQQQPLPNSNPNFVSDHSKTQVAPSNPKYKWPRKPLALICPKCGASVTTRVESTPTVVTIGVSILLFLLCFLLVFIPFLTRSCKKTTHYCTNCNSLLGERAELK